MKSKLLLCLALVLLARGLLRCDAATPTVQKLTTERALPILPPIAAADPFLHRSARVEIPTHLVIQRTAGALSVHPYGSEATNLMVGSGMGLGLQYKLFVYPVGKPRPANAVRTGLSNGSLDPKGRFGFEPGTDCLTAKQDGVPVAGKCYVVEARLTVFETDVPPQHAWKPCDKSYMVLFRRTLKDIVAAGPQITQIHMLDIRRGWAEAEGPEGFRVLRTTDGARTWADVTPKPFPYEAWECEFAKPSTAWISVNSNSWAGLLMTTNGGKTWAKVTTPFGYFEEASDVRFFNRNVGVCKASDGALGSSYYTFYKTLNGGVTWDPMNVTPRNPEPGPGVSPHTFHLSDMYDDKVAYYPPESFIVVYGSGDDRPKGCVRLSISSNSGNSWRDLKLPLPRGYRNCRATPLLPIFFGARKGLMPVYLCRWNADFRVTLAALLFYRTDNAGHAWTPTRPIAVSKNGAYADDPGSELAVVSSEYVIVRSGRMLLVTQDGAQTWRIIRPNIDLGAENAKRDVRQLNFVDANHGWLIISDETEPFYYGHYLLYQTADGGKLWRAVPLKIRQ